MKNPGGNTGVFSSPPLDQFRTVCEHDRMNRTFLEFFAGGGMARLGLGADWTCLLANDIDPKKMQTYRANFGAESVVCCDVAELGIKSLGEQPTLAWASFPCQDLSLAGNRIGLAGERSRTFWGFWSVINRLKLVGREPPLLVLENVCGLLTSHNGQDFRDLCRAIGSLGYNFGALVVDAIEFLPQSRPRLFLVCARDKKRIPQRLFANGPIDPWHNQSLRAVAESLPLDLRANWIWWNLPAPPRTKATLAQLLEANESAANWHTTEQTRALLAMMSSVNREKVAAAQRTGKCTVGTIYKRTRIEGGLRQQRAEVRFDGIAGCLRTPGGGSSRQTLIIVEGKSVRTRLLTIREAARLMGVSDTYAIPENYNDGYHIFGDGLAVPAVAHIARNILDPIANYLAQKPQPRRKIAA